MKDTTLRRITRVAGATLLAAAVAPWIATGSAQAADAVAPPSGDDRAVSHSGNATTCEDVGFPNSLQVGAAESAGSNANGFTVTNDGTYIDYTAPAGVVVDVAVVKGSDAYNVYPAGATTDLHAPLTGNDQNIAGVSHWFICYHAVQTQPTSPSVSFTDDCDSTVVSFTQGSEPVTFSVTAPDGTSTDTDGDEPLDLPADAENGTTTVTVGDAVLASHEWVEPESGCDTVEVPAGPDAVFIDDCDEGLIVGLVNDGEDGAPSTEFSVTAPDESVAKHTVAQGDQVTLNFDAKAGDKVTVSNPDLAGTLVHTFAPQGCTEVEGEQTDKPSPGVTVLGEKDVSSSVGDLPFTGFNVGQALALSMMLLLLGSLLIATPTVVPARYQRRH